MQGFLIAANKLKRIVRTGSLITALTALSACCTTATADTYRAVLDQAQQLSNSRYVSVTKQGSSVKGRPIYAFTATDPRLPESICHTRIRLLIIAGQHGDEVTPVKSALALIKSLANGWQREQRDILRSVVITVVPAANPDGLAAGTRKNAAGADINRDWQQASQPETQAMWRLCKSLKPHVIIDQHEWTADDPYRPNCIEVTRDGKDAASRLARALTYQTRTDVYTRGTLLRPTYYTAQSDQRMAHRHFTKQGICSLLVETTPDWPSARRIEVYSEVVRSVISNLINPADESVAAEINVIRKQRGTAATAIAAHYLPKQPKDETPYPGPTTWAILAAAVLVLAKMTGNSSKKQKEPTIAHKHDKSYADRSRTLTDVVSYDIPIRARLAIIHELRQRPSDRTKTSIAA